MGGTSWQKGLQRKNFNHWKAKNVSNHGSGFRSPAHASGKGYNRPPRTAGSIASVKDGLPELDYKKTQAAIEEVLKKYQFFKSITFEELETDIALNACDALNRNIFDPEARRSFCERVERAVDKLYPKEKLLVTERYMKDNHVTDTRMYKDVMPMSRDTYAKIGRSAFYSLAFNLDHFRIININELVRIYG
ncbi:hypothetical protein ACXZ7E_02600 [Paenibacillus lautus]